MTDLLTRARNMSAMLRMCEKISFGSDADMIDELAGEIQRLRDGFEYMRDYPKDGTPRRTEDGYPAEIVYDEFSYKRMVDSYREACSHYLGELND